MTKLAVAVGFLALNFYVYHYFATSDVIPPRQTFASFPLELGPWHCPEQEQMDPKVRKNLGATDYIICNYMRRNPPAMVGFYVGYNATQVRSDGGGTGVHTIHPPKHCLPGSGWDIIGAKQISLDLPGLPQRPAKVNRLLIAKGQARALVYYWYESRGRVIASDWRKIVYLFWDRATRHRTDGSLVRFTIPLSQTNDPAQADREFRSFASRALPELPKYIPN